MSDAPERGKPTCCDRPMITARAYPAGSYYDYAQKAVVTRMVTEWRCINCGAGGCDAQ